MVMPVTGAPSRDPQDPQDPRSVRSALAGDLGAAAVRRQWRRRRRRQWTMGVMAGLTVVSLAVIAGFVLVISRTPVQAQPAALTAKAHPVAASAIASGSARTTAPASASRPVPKGPQVTDASSGLSYQLLSRPWQKGCPAVLQTPVFRWTAGEHAVAGRADVGGAVITWHGNACSGVLQQAFSYGGPADLGPVATGVADATDPAYYAGLNHQRTLEQSSSIQVSGHPAWIVTFGISYPDAAREGLAWTSEEGAVVVVDRGTGRLPAVFYASVPGNLGTGTLATLIGSLRLASGTSGA
jgi:hypothetical protein